MSRKVEQPKVQSSMSNAGTKTQASSVVAPAPSVNAAPFVITARSM
eukprot:CAMPEP_0171771358 /NCGR_PEP_ID=MMETSP0991-20121206/54017_1 /TAXON_ID=483369 /ORGANISM="non described non described, Strain CCMP2098" /LENGTH=45 /DNA_ID= /DNA_START= /DNA_END= /DNA_ORIENTATION=